VGLDVEQCWGYDTDVSEEFLSLNETYIEVRTGKNNSDLFLIQIGLREGDALLSLLCKFASEYVIRKDKNIKRNWKWADQ